MRRYDSTLPAVVPSSAGNILAHDLRRAVSGSIAGAALALCAVGIVAIVVRDWDWSWLCWPLIGAAIPWLALAIGNLAELVRSLAERITHIDLDGDGVIGQPEPAGDPFRLIVARGPVDRQAEQDADLRHVIHQTYIRGLRFHDWKGYKLPSGKMVDEASWRLFLQRLTDAGMITPGRPGQSAQWLCEEAEVLRRFV